MDFIKEKEDYQLKIIFMRAFSIEERKVAMGKSSIQRQESESQESFEMVFFRRPRPLNQSLKSEISPKLILLQNKRKRDFSQSEKSHYRSTISA